MDTPAHILVVDDHREMRELVGRLLERDGYRVSRAADGHEMLNLLRDRPVDLIVLDLMLPSIDGLDLCRNLRAGSCNVPIIMLTAKGGEIDRVLGLEMGADDYLAKPFSGRELTARIKAVLRRARSMPPEHDTLTADVYRFGGWSLFPSRRELEAADGTVVPISSTELKLLLAFVRRPGRVLSREQLLDLTRGRSAAPLDRSVDLQISRLRRKIRDDASNPRLIKTVWGDGYLLDAEVSSG